MQGLGRDIDSTFADLVVRFCRVANASDPGAIIAYLQDASLRFVEEEYVSGMGEEGTTCEWRWKAKVLTPCLLISLPQS